MAVIIFKNFTDTFYGDEQIKNVDFNSIEYTNLV